MVGIDRCPDSPQLNSLIQGGTEADEFLDLSNYPTSSLSVVPTPLTTIPLEGGIPSQSEYFPYNTDILQNTTDDINTSGFPFNFQEPHHPNQLAYTQPVSMFGPNFQEEHNAPDPFIFRPQGKAEIRPKLERSSSPAMGSDLEAAKSSDHVNSCNKNYTVGAGGHSHAKVKQEYPTDSVDLNTYIDGVRPRDAYLVHLEVMRTLDSEVEFESHFLAVHEQFKEDEERERKIRRNQGNIEWKAGTSFGYLGLGKQKTLPKSYQKRMPKKSCFGIINMRRKNAWKRKPNKPRRGNRRS